MKKNILMWFVLFFLLTLSDLILGEKLAVLSEVLKPNEIVLDGNQFYITENTSIYIYSLEDFKLKKKFGKQGEGPAEFMDFVEVTPQDDRLLVNSFRKISSFTKDGRFISELKAGQGAGRGSFYPLANGFVGRGAIMEKGEMYLTINFFDSNLRKGKELYRMKSARQFSGKIKILKQSFIYRTHGNKMFVVGKSGFIIDVLDQNGKLLFSINREYEKRKFTPEDEKNMREVLKSLNYQQYEMLQHRLQFPEFYPEIEDFLITDGKIYVFTYKIENNKVETFTFSLDGKFLKKMYVHLAYQTPILPYPFKVRNGKIYQVIENDDEEWELHVSAIK